MNENLPHRAALNPVPRVNVYCIYRAKNARFVLQTIKDLPSGCRVDLHALDLVAPELAPWTRSEGPGERLPLLDGLIRADPPDPGRGILITDDDVVFRKRSGASRFLALAHAGGFDLAQPAHGVMSTHTFRLNSVAWLSTARSTRFVEVGPLVYFSTRVLPLVIPLPSQGMGFGLDVEWSGLVDLGYRLGVIDATPIRHHGNVGADYDVGAEWSYLDAALRRVGVESIGQLLEEFEPKWRPWQPHPPWGMP